jgi:hypothetical protein
MIPAFNARALAQLKWMRRALSKIRGELTWRLGHDFGV